MIYNIYLFGDDLDDTFSLNNAQIVDRSANYKKRMILEAIRRDSIGCIHYSFRKLSSDMES